MTQKELVKIAQTLSGKDVKPGFYGPGFRILHEGVYDPHVLPVEPPVGTWVMDRFGAVDRRVSAGWGTPGTMPFGKWPDMWEARGPYIEVGEWGGYLAGGLEEESLTNWLREVVEADPGDRMREEETIYRIDCRLRKAGAFPSWTCYMSQTPSMPTDLDWWEQKIQGQREKNPHAEFRLLRIRKTTEVLA